MKPLQLIGWTVTSALAATLAWQWDLWLLAAVWSTGITAVEVRRRRTRAVTATRIATLAKVAQTGALTASAVELLLAADLAARTAHAPMVLIAARDATEELHDPWRRALAAERLEAAAALLMAGEVRPAGRLNESTWFAAGWVSGGGAAVSFATGAATGSRLFMVVGVLCLAVVGGAIGAAHTRKECITVAVIAAAVDPLPPEGAVLGEEALVHLLADLGHGEPRAFARAEAIAVPFASEIIRAAARTSTSHHRRQL